MTPSSQQVTQLLIAWKNRDQAALDELMPLVYAELHRLAHRHPGHERRSHTPQSVFSARTQTQRSLEIRRSDEP